MEPTPLLLFAVTVLPLICTPGPDLLFIASQAINGGAAAGLRATAGVCAGYALHSLLVALGLAAIIAASPWLFEALRWIGVAYLAYLAVRLIRSAMKAGSIGLQAAGRGRQFRRGLLTAALNPKGMMIYFAILPQFMRADEPAAAQAMALSAIFIALCALVYAGLSVLLGLRRGGGFSDRRRRWVEGVSGGMVAIAAVVLARD
ncbi:MULTISPECIES: LysE family translocator [unclassified Lysobacter]|uniref:LysE family translocator n=1 Tax=unclassified Lysobacter TaxID=2635362 RepID=UPI001BEBE904|nr:MULTISPECIES: LysE family translocator [unclassified Lysobacter]MBT2744780.1 LysE family translocator [Lysobacter sp. ISL-42]MBT2752227.1 LysE family translocator [Lysobacter sp. ISL-50]MBT2778724.1 LysE family translocator [Lysobacter sp. ISL-54]MBT2780345.1 LysE family translocator [Lysobacter sp. ISL-52]